MKLFIIIDISCFWFFNINVFLVGCNWFFFSPILVLMGYQATTNVCTSYFFKLFVVGIQKNRL